MRKWAFIGGVFLAAGCAAEVSPDWVAAGRGEFIVDGTRETGEPAVVLVYNTAGGLCTGTLIAPRVVLTAKHCVQASGASGPYPPSAFIIGVGSYFRGLTQQFRVSEVRTTPGAWSDGRGGLGGALVGIDIGLLTLTDSDPSIVPYRVRFDPPTDQIGRTQRAIGFGETPSGEVGVKYQTTTEPYAVRSGVIYTGPAICQGDSGGPLIQMDTNEVIGVASFGTGECGSGYAGYNRVDSETRLSDGQSLADIIQEVVEASGSCVGMTAEVCDGRDNDCDGEVDQTCTRLGGACSSDDECVGNFCDMTIAGRICTAVCDPLQPSIGCETGMYCARATGCEGRCVPLPDGVMLGMLGDDSDCTADYECASLTCIDPGDGRRRCLTPCRGDAGGCLVGEACAANPGDCSGCVPAEIVVASRGLGEPCADADECRSGMCLEDGAGPYCSRSCTEDAECAMAFHCRDGSCIRGRREDIGGSCLANGDCAAGLFCATRGETSWCTDFCAVAEDCPMGFTCTDVGGASICVPDLGLVGDRCETNDDCLSTTCADVGARSVCVRMCSRDAPCGTGFECVRSEDGVTAFCIEPAPPGAAKDDGCGCIAPGAGSTPRLPSMILVLGALVMGGWARRRRRES